jgi:hypothetical protein
MSKHKSKKGNIFPRGQVDTVMTESESNTSKNISGTSAVPVLNTVLPASPLPETHPGDEDEQSEDDDVSDNEEGEDEKKVTDALIVIDSTNVLGDEDLRLEDVTTQLDGVEIEESEDLEDSGSI